MHLKLQDKFRGHASMTGANALWGAMSPISKIVMASGCVSSLLLADFRIVGATLCFWIASLFTKQERVSRRDLMLLAAAGMLGICFNQTTFVMGLGLTSPINASIITTTAPIIVMVLATSTGRESITWHKIVGIILCLFGALTLVMGSLGIGTSNSAGNIWGDLLCIFAQFCYSAYFVFFRGVVSRYSPITAMKWMFTFSTIVIVPFSWDTLTSMQWDMLSTVEIAGSSYIVVGATFMSFMLIAVGQRILPPTLACMYNYMQPLVAAAIAISLGLDKFGFDKIIAVALVFSGVYIVTRTQTSRRVSEV